MKDKLKEQFINKLCNEYNMEVINEEQFCDFIDQNFIGKEELRKKIKEEIWVSHELTDNFGMTLEQSKKVNDLITLAYNNAFNKLLELLK